MFPTERVRMIKFELSIIVPCFNEYNRIPSQEYKSFLKTKQTVHLCFVNDGSTDGTLEKLLDIQKCFPKQVIVISNENNQGKGASVRRGILHCKLLGKADCYSYLDADLSVSLDECYSYLTSLTKPKSFVFASRILRIGATVERKFSRFLIGRIVATVISGILRIPVYDTQCGCKLFKEELAQALFHEPFISKWLFDVELFSRLICKYGKKDALKMMEEIPVKKWVDKEESKVKTTYFFKLWRDLYLIRKKHKKEISLTSKVKNVSHTFY